MQDCEKRFCLIINRYCDSLAKFIDAVKQPTEFNIKKIQEKNTRSGKFDEYVLFIENFNELTSTITNTIKIIIMALNDLFIHKTIETLIKFLASIQQFLTFLTNKNIFMRLIEVRESFDHRYQNTSQFIKKLDDARVIIFRIFNISVTIASIFIPEIAFVTPVINQIEQSVIHYTDDVKIVSNDENIDIDKVIKTLLDTQLRSEIISNIDINIIYSCTQDKQSPDLLNIIENLQSEYISMIVISIALKSEISFYRKRKKNVFSNFLEYCKSGNIDNQNI